VSLDNTRVQLEKCLRYTDVKHECFESQASLKKQVGEIRRELKASIRQVEILIHGAELMGSVHPELKAMLIGCPYHG
jgi:hypothetical protein